jgi:GWxTD domain-containing protein
MRETMNRRSGLRALALAAALALVCAGPAVAQPRAFPDPPKDARRVFYEAVSVIDGDSSLARVDVLYRIDRDFFVSFRNPDSSAAPPFRRHGELVLELLDSADNSRAREIHRIEIAEAGGEAPSPDRQWYAGVASLHLPRGRYTLVVELDDLESERRFLERNRMIDVRTARGDTLPEGGPLMLAGTPTAGTTECVPQNFGGDVGFGSPGALAIGLKGKLPDSSRFHYTLTTAPGPRSPEEPVVLLDTTVAPVVFQGMLQLRAGAEGDTVRYDMVPGGTPATLAVLPLPLETLPLRSYELHARMLRHGAPVVGFTVRFRNVWPDMPFSLQDVDKALDALRYVTTPDQLDSLESGPFEARRDHLEAFWKPRDRTPGTAYNEVMTEYYRRVDHTIRTFGSIRDPDGSRTDRGRIYILHGPPSRIERTLDPRTGFSEVWTYSSPRKTFVFVDQNKSGTYVLVPSKQP